MKYKCATHCDLILLELVFNKNNSYQNFIIIPFSERKGYTVENIEKKVCLRKPIRKQQGLDRQ